jgi:hypothetical protein
MPTYIEIAVLTFPFFLNVYCTNGSKKANVANHFFKCELEISFHLLATKNPQPLATPTLPITWPMSN